jgi:hypothetical protein
MITGGANGIFLGKNGLFGGKGRVFWGRNNLFWGKNRGSGGKMVSPPFPSPGFLSCYLRDVKLIYFDKIK